MINGVAEVNYSNESMLGSRMRLGCLVPNKATTSSMFISKCLLACMSARPLSLSCPMVLRKYVFRRRKEEIDRSHEQVVTGIVPSSLKSVCKLGYATLFR